MRIMVLEIRSLEDLERAADVVGLPVGPRRGRSKAKKEWYVLLGFLETMVPAGLVGLPMVVRSGNPPAEPDFVATCDDEALTLFEVTEATNEADQREMTAFERSGSSTMLLGEFGGRFADGASQPGLVWAADIVQAIKTKRGKAIFETSAAARHLLIYPNSNASALLFDEDDEREAANVLVARVAEDVSLCSLLNGCVVHVLGAYLVCVDVLGRARMLSRRCRA